MRDEMGGRREREEAKMRPKREMMTDEFIMLT